MILSALVREMPMEYRILGNAEVEVTSLCMDSRNAGENCLFICTPGLNRDAHDFAPQAVKQGAAALLVSRPLDLPCAQIVVDDVRMATSYIAANFYGNPARHLHMIGITGTKGKTTCSFLLKSILEQAGKQVGLIGTVCTMIGSETMPAKLTTPDPVDMQRILRHMLDKGAEYVIMEISAHAVALHRLDGIVFDVGAFTNFSQDHLDFFGDMDTYFQAKMRFFAEDMVRSIVYNPDDERVAAGIAALGRPALRTGIRAMSDVYAKNVDVYEWGMYFKLVHHKHFQEEISLHMTGLFNVYNALTAAGLAIALGMDSASIRKGLEAVRGVPGRVEVLETDTPYRVILDYAHSPDSLENVLNTLKATVKNGKLIALFGCGGNRDKGKRPMMGEVAGRIADFCILTSDNPRSEDPYEILRAIENGIRTTDCEYIVIENRREAIRYALTHAQAGDVVVLAGKGHETYQEIQGVKHPFDEKIVVAELLREMRG